MNWNIIAHRHEVTVNRHVLCHDVPIFSTSGQHINHDTEKWLNSEVGYENWDRTVQDKITFWFKYEEDKFKFILKWL